MPSGIETLHPRDLGARLREARTAGGWTQEQAAREIGAARTTMVAIEKGERPIRPDELIGLARLYSRKLSSLLRPGAPVEELATQLQRSLRPDAPEAEVLPAIRELERLYDDYLELERLCGATVHRREPAMYSLEAVDPEQAAEDVATAERNRRSTSGPSSRTKRGCGSSTSTSLPRSPGCTPTRKSTGG
jgi:DNA-binding XRE family transcriptional regulator